MSAPYRWVAFFRKIIDLLFAEARHFRPRPFVWLSDWLSNSVRRVPVCWRCRGFTERSKAALLSAIDVAEPKHTGLVCELCKQPVAVLVTVTPTDVHVKCPACGHEWSTQPPKSTRAPS